MLQTKQILFNETAEQRDVRNKIERNRLSQTGLGCTQEEREKCKRR